MPEYPTISLCLIAKNEEHCIAQAIESVKPIVTEIILVDTGSTDRTVEIAKALGAQVYFRAWDDDFSPPRNLSIEKASADWILVLDADEAVAESDLEDLRKLTLDNGCCYEFNQRHYSNDHRLSDFRPCAGEYPAWERNYGGFFESALVRLFPNKHGVEYRGRVHELVEHSIREKGKHKIVRSRIPIHHYGHTPEVAVLKNKGAIYAPLGEAKLKDNPKHWQNYFEMGVEHNRGGRYEESVAAFLKAISLNPSYLPAWVNIGYVLCEMGKFGDALTSLSTALEIDPSSSEAHCNLGVVFMRRNELPRAEAHFRRAIQLAPDYVNAYCNLGKTLAMLQRLAEAVNIYNRALELLPNCTTARADLGAIYFASRDWGRAEKFLSEAVQSDPCCARALYHLGMIYKATQRTREAIEVLQKFCEVERASNPSAPPSRLVIQTELECELMKST